MPEYQFRIGDELRTVEADDSEDAVVKAGIGERDDYELIGGDDFEDRCLMSSITDDILFGS